MYEFYLSLKPYIIGNMPLAEFAAAMLFACATAAVFILFRVSTRDPLSDRSPVNFSWSYFWNDTFKRNVGTVLLIFLTIRIVQYWIAPRYAIYSAILIGLISDQLAMLMLKLKDKLVSLISGKIDAAVLPTSAPKDEEIQNK
jgi:hypothetical protein